jgi:DNA-binding NarL/FixJ family response regulator
LSSSWPSLLPNSSMVDRIPTCEVAPHHNVAAQQELAAVGHAVLDCDVLLQLGADFAWPRFYPGRALRERFGWPSPREREIMIQVARGRLSKQIAGDIGIAEATVKVHRSRAMHKMNTRSLPELGRMADKLKLVTDKPQHS